MKLSDLVHFKNELDLLSTESAESHSRNELLKILHVLDTWADIGQMSTEEFKHSQHNIQQAFDDFDHKLVSLKNHINQRIEQQERDYFKESYRLYDKEMIYETTEYILQRRNTLTPEASEILNARLSKYADWKYAGLVIRPGLESFVKNMVMYDPLYLVDQDHELLVPTLSDFNIEYQRRLRTYVVNERTESNILDTVPDGQFGICLAYNFFNFKPFEVLKQYLVEVYQKLKPGGVFILTINDCDRYKAVMLVEQSFCCYTPGKLVKELAKTIGYQIEFEWHDNGAWTWLEIRKPGTLTSLRGGQTLAKIMPKSLESSK